MEDPMEGHYEEKFEFPLLTLIQKIAEEKDISYAEAADYAIPEYAKTMKIRDTKYMDEVIAKRQREMVEKAERDREEMEATEKGGH